MKTKIRTCFAMVAAGALMALSGSSLAQDGKPSAIKLDDAQLDQITAGNSAFSVVQVFNPGNAGVIKRTGNHITCINCEQLPVEVSRTFGAVNVVLPNGKMVNNSIGQPPF